MGYQKRIFIQVMARRKNALFVRTINEHTGYTGFGVYAKLLYVLRGQLAVYLGNDEGLSSTLSRGTIKINNITNYALHPIGALCAAVVRLPRGIRKSITANGLPWRTRLTASIQNNSLRQSLANLGGEYG